VEYLRGLMLIMIGDGEELLDLPAETIASMRNTAAEASLRQVIRALKLFNEAGRALKGSLHPQLPLELAFIEAATPDQAGPGALPQIKDDTGTQARPVAHVPASAPRATTVAAPSPATAYAAPPPEPERPPTSVQTPAKTGGGISLEVARSQWTEILQAVRPQSRSVEALLKSGYPENVVGNTIIIGFEHEFHKRKIKDGENSRLVEDAIQQVLGQPCRVECELASRPATQPVATPGPQASPAKTGPSPVQTQETPSAARRREAVQDPVIQVAVEELGAQVVDVTDNQ